MLENNGMGTFYDPIEEIWRMAANPTPKVLVIDDEAGIVEMIQSLLEVQGYESIATTQWTGVIDAAEHEKPQLMLLDLNMPTIDGVSLLKFLREQGYTFPVVVVSGYIDDEIRATLKPFGVVGFVDKPFEIKHLSDVVDRAISSQTPNDEHVMEDLSASSKASVSDMSPSESSDLERSPAETPALEDSDSEASSLEPSSSEMPVSEPVLPQTTDLHNPGTLSPRRNARRNRTRVMVPPPRKPSIFRRGMVQYFLIAVVCMLLAGFLIIIVEQNEEKPIQLYLPR